MRLDSSFAHIEGQLSQWSGEALKNRHREPEQAQDARLHYVQRSDVVQICAIVADRDPCDAFKSFKHHLGCWAGC